MNDYKAFANKLSAVAEEIADQPGAEGARIGLVQAAGSFAIAGALQEIADSFRTLQEIADSFRTLVEAAKNEGPPK